MADMQTIWKYPLEITDKQTVLLPVHATLLCVQAQGESLCLWALLWPDVTHTKARVFRIFGTGDRITDGEAMQHVGTVQMGGLVWHVFEQFA